MVIAVNTRFLLKDKLEGYGYFIRETFSRIAQAHPEHQFYFLFDRPVDPGLSFPSNVHTVVIPPPARHPLLWKWWYDVRVPVVLKKIRADVFVSPDGICSLTTRVPQCLVIHDLGIIHRPGDYKKSHVFYYKRQIPKFLKKAKAVATVSEFSRQDIVRQYSLAPEQIDVVYNGVRESFRPLPLEEQEATREKYTGGTSYFIYLGALQPRKNLLRLLRAFSIFKKRLQSNMKLVLAGRLAWKNDTFLEQLKTYKYRDDVVITGYLEEAEVAKLVASSYALVYPSLFEGFGVPVLEALRCGVPALSSENSSMQEIAGSAGLYFNPADHADIADKLMRIYKDEALRNRMMEKGKEVAARFSWDRTAALMWSSIEKALGTEPSKR